MPYRGPESSLREHAESACCTQEGLCTPYRGPESRRRHRITPLQTGSHLVPHYKDTEDTRPPDQGTESRCSRPRAQRKGLLGHPLSH
ncbi:hypothetical protein GW7_05548 [Heterocephalus glaber]|uniref:Uncharacterized protein n=1 Tax=Heterocephalus glaber TaxID=10181 RepID=G5AMV8_HETGA|nr:hypothetical protein GW7_05548 [Heterocephalus glaber]